MSGIKIEEYVNFFSLYKYGTVHGHVVSTQIYIHSKMLIVDDLKMIVGSQNINDRSLLGSRDSEVAIMICDGQEKVNVKFGNQTVQVNKFVQNARIQLWKEHLQIQDDILWEDPTSPYCYEQLWINQAVKNTKIFDEVFPGKPQDSIKREKDFNFAAAPKNVEKLKDVVGHHIMFPLQFFQQEHLKFPVAEFIFQ